MGIKLNNVNEPIPAKLAIFAFIIKTALGTASVTFAYNNNATIAMILTMCIGACDAVLILSGNNPLDKKKNE